MRLPHLFASALVLVTVPSLGACRRSGANDTTTDTMRDGAAPITAPTSTPRTSTCQDDLQVTSSSGVQFADYKGDAKLWAASPALRLDIEPPVVSKTSVELVAVLKNSGSTTVDAVVKAPGSPWIARLDLPLHPPPPRLAGETTPPEVFPYPKAATLPAGASVRYAMKLCLDSYQAAAARSTTLEWSFLFWNGARTGSTPVTLL